MKRKNTLDLNDIGIEIKQLITIASYKKKNSYKELAVFINIDTKEISFAVSHKITVHKHFERHFDTYLAASIYYNHLVI